MKLRNAIIKGGSSTYVSAVIVAAGSGSRMGFDKILHKISSVPAVIRAVLPFEKCENVDEIVIVASEQNLDAVSSLCSEYGIKKVSKIICGGETRLDSSLSGVMQCSDRADFILIHDGARPLVSTQIISDVIRELKYSPAVVPAVACSDTVRCADKNLYVSSELDRESTYLVQTPQGFDASLIKGALCFAKSNSKLITDDSSAAAIMGAHIKIVKGERENIKLTYPVDIFLAEAIIKSRGDTL